MSFEVEDGTGGAPPNGNGAAAPNGSAADKSAELELFLSARGLIQYHQQLVDDLGVKEVGHLQMLETADMAKIGMSDAEAVAAKEVHGETQAAKLSNGGSSEMTARDYYEVYKKNGFQEVEEEDSGDELLAGDVRERQEFEALMKVITANAKVAREERERKDREAKEKADKALNLKPKSKLMEDFEAMEQPLGENVVAGKSLCCLRENVGLRHALNRWVTHPLTENFLLVCIK
eukprot:SAG22_NODE_2896_length_2119_cov_1.382673_2_plen_233_part_00